MFVIQRILEVEGKMTLLDQSKVIRSHKFFRLFATANTIGLGDRPGSITAPSRSTRPDGPSEHRYQPELSAALTGRDGDRIVVQSAPTGTTTDGRQPIEDAPMVACARTYRCFAGLHQWRYLDRHVAADRADAWAENAEIFDDVAFAFRCTFLNKCDETERPIVAEYYQRLFRGRVAGRAACRYN